MLPSLPLLLNTSCALYMTLCARLVAHSWLYVCRPWALLVQAAAAHCIPQVGLAWGIL